MELFLESIVDWMINSLATHDSVISEEKKNVNFEYLFWIKIIKGKDWERKSRN